MSSSVRSRNPHRDPRRDARSPGTSRSRWTMGWCCARIFSDRSEDGRIPGRILTYGIYAKGVAYQEGYAHQWNKMVADYPEILEGSTNTSIKTGRSRTRSAGSRTGIRVCASTHAALAVRRGSCSQTRPVKSKISIESIEWAGTQDWCNGKVGMLGISYYARNQWRVAALHPPHLAAILPWEGGNDTYRDFGLSTVAF